MITAIIFFVVGIVLVGYTIRMLSIVPLIPFRETSLIMSRKLFGSYKAIFVAGHHYRYYLGGKWYRRSSWSNTPNGESGATIPGPLSWVRVRDRDITIEHHPLKSWLYKYIFRKKIADLRCASFIFHGENVLTVRDTITCPGLFQINNIPFPPGLYNAEYPHPLFNWTE
jgi:hypothetical protein